MRNLFTAVRCITAAVLLALGMTACGGAADADPAQFDLVFVSDTGTRIGCVTVHAGNPENPWTEGAQNADSSPLSRGETFGFEVTTYPATVTVYKDTQAKISLAALTVKEAPPEGGRWYVIATDGPGGMDLKVSGHN